jgi:hypothetical protein
MYSFRLFILLFFSQLFYNSFGVTTKSKNNSQAILISPKDCQFIKPIQLPFNLAGSFAEPRTNHFHAGIDIKTNQKEGYPIFAIGDGYISRIKIAPNGYGKVLYITHPNGYTSVYAHLQNFNTSIDSFIKIYIYKNKLNEIDINLKAHEIPIKKGNTIAYSGNTGSSTAPHLHFEIRETKTEHALNPLDFYPANFYIDSIAPQINQIYIKEYLNTNFVVDTTQILNAKFYEQTNSKTITIHQPYFSIALDAFDKQDASENKNGIQRIEIIENKKTFFSYHIQRIDFEQTSACNVFFDYNYYLSKKKYAYNCFQLKNNLLPIYPIKNKNYYTLQERDTLKLSIHAYDYNQNKKTLFLNITYQKQNEKKAVIQNIKNAKTISYANAYKINAYPFSISLKKNTFYDNAILHFSLDSLKQLFFISLYNDETPLHQNATIEIVSNIQQKHDKIIIIQQDRNGTKNALNTSYINGKFIATSKNLGTFYLEYDSIAPTISNLSISNSSISATINDNLSGIKSYHLYINNIWTPLYFDYKNKQIQTMFSEKINPKSDKIKIEVLDKCNNRTILEE